MKPTLPIYDERFDYTPAALSTTDRLRAKFRQIQDDLDAQKKAATVTPIRVKKDGAA